MIMVVAYHEQRNLYLKLIAGTVLILATMFIADEWIQVAGKNKDQMKFLQRSSASGELINNLLISVDEMTIAEKTAFINLYLKQDNLASEGRYADIRQQRTEVYSKILRRKVNKANHGKADDDFYIQAVPK